MKTIDVRFPWKKAVPLILAILAIITPLFVVVRRIDVFGDDIWFIPVIFLTLAAILIPSILYMNKKYNSELGENGEFIRVNGQDISAQAVSDVELWGDSSGVTAVLTANTSNGPVQTRIILTNRAFPLKSPGIGALGRLIELSQIPNTAQRPPYSKLGTNRVPVGKAELMPFLHELWDSLRAKGK